MKNRIKGFTLIELITVITILGFLLLLIVPRLSMYGEKVKDKELLVLEETILNAARQYASAFSEKLPPLEQPGDFYSISVQNLIDGGFLIRPLINPRTNVEYDYSVNIDIYFNENGSLGVRLVDENTNSFLSSLTVSGFALNPTFEKGVSVYEVSSAGFISSAIINATAEQSGATVTGTGTKTLSPGTNVFEITVTAKDTVSRKKYRIVIYSGNLRLDINPLSVAYLKGTNINFTENVSTNGTLTYTCKDSTNYTLLCPEIKNFSGTYYVTYVSTLGGVSITKKRIVTIREP